MASPSSVTVAPPWALSQSGLPARGGPGHCSFSPTAGRRRESSTSAVQFRLLELLFDQSAEIHALLGPVLRAQTAQAAELRSHLGTVDPDAAVTPYLGRY